MDRITRLLGRLDARIQAEDRPEVLAVLGRRFAALLARWRREASR